MGAPLEQLSSLVGRERISEPERPRVLRNGLPVRACRSSPRTCLWCPPQDLLAVADQLDERRGPAQPVELPVPEQPGMLGLVDRGDIG